MVCKRAHTQRTIFAYTFKSGSSVDTGKVASFQEQMSAGGDKRKSNTVGLILIVGFGKLNTADATDKDTSSVIFFKSSTI